MAAERPAPPSPTDGTQQILDWLLSHKSYERAGKALYEYRSNGRADQLLQTLREQGRETAADRLDLEMGRIERALAPMTPAAFIEAFEAGEDVEMLAYELEVISAKGQTKILNHLPREAAVEMERIVAHAGLALKVDLLDGSLVRTGSAKTAAAAVDLHSRFLYGNEIASIPQPDPFVEGVIDLNTVSMVYGAWGSYKTFVVLDIGYHVVVGHPWCGRPVKQGKVLYVVAEGAPGMNARSRAWCEHHLGDADAHLPDFIWLPYATQLTDAEIVDQIIEGLVKEVEPGEAVLLVFDTFARVMVGVDENSAKELGVVIDALERVREAVSDHGIDIAVLIVHHAGKDKDRGSRGNSALPGALASVFEASKAEGDEVLLKCKKQKDRPETPALRFRPVAVGASIVLEPVEATASTSRRNDEILDANILNRLQRLDFGDGVSSTKWEEACCGMKGDENSSSDICPRTKFHERKAELVRLGYVRKVGTSLRAPFALTDQGKDHIRAQTSGTSGNVRQTSPDDSDGSPQMSVRPPPTRGGGHSDIWVGAEQSLDLPAAAIEGV